MEKDIESVVAAVQRASNIARMVTKEQPCEKDGDGDGTNDDGPSSAERVAKEMNPCSDSTSNVDPDNDDDEETRSLLCNETIVEENAQPDHSIDAAGSTSNSLAGNAGPPDFNRDWFGTAVEGIHGTCTFDGGRHWSAAAIERQTEANKQRRKQYTGRRMWNRTKGRD